MSERVRDFETVAAHAGVRLDAGDAIPTVSPIAASTTFTGDSIHDVHAALSEDDAGFAYARNGNPTVRALEGVLAEMEHAEDAVAFGSGMAAISAAVFGLDLESGDQIVAASALYGVTRSLFAQLANFGIITRYVDVHDLAAVEEAVSGRDVRTLYLESIANPLLEVPDVAALTSIAHDHRVRVIVDNTFATPYLFRPLDDAVDLVIHSATKYIAGHGDVMAGLVAGSRAWAQRVRSRRTALGAVLSPFEAWLTLRGIRTLPLRMTRQCESAALIAEWLGQQGWVERVYYPGLAGTPDRGVATRQFGGKFGGMVAFELRASRADVLTFLDALRLIVPGTSLGDVVSLALYPPLSSHRGLTPGELRAAGIREGLVRLSVGLESARDLVDDLTRAACASGVAGATAPVAG